MVTLTLSSLQHFAVVVACGGGLMLPHPQVVRPPPRNQPGLAADGSGRLLLFGGFDAEHEALGDAWLCTGDGWSTLPSGPPPRGSHALVFVNDATGFFLFGGIRQGIRFDDTWLFAAGAWQPWLGNTPPARSAHSLAYDRSRDRVVLFGGSTRAGLVRDTWEWDGRAWEQVARSGPTPRRNHAMAFDALRGATVLFGGADSTGRLNDTWSWDGAAWTELYTEEAPRRRDHHAMTHSNRFEGVVVYGGWDGEYLSDLWQWTGRTWILVTASGPERAGRPGLAEHAGEVLLYGGAGPDGVVGAVDSYRADTWRRANICP